MAGSWACESSKNSLYRQGNYFADFYISVVVTSERVLLRESLRISMPDVILISSFAKLHRFTRHFEM